MATRIEHVIRCLEEAYGRIVALGYDEDGIKQLVDEAWGHAVAARDGGD